MDNSKTKLERPCLEQAKKYLDDWAHNERFQYSDKGLNKLFSLLPNNTDTGEVLIKAAALNSIYSTNIFKISTVAEHIVKLSIDKYLAAGDISVVNKLAQVDYNGKIINFFSFATKYCNFHKPEIYPIFDQYVGKTLWHWLKVDNYYKCSRNELRDYNVFFEVISSFRSFYKLEELSFKKLDQYIWEYGNEHFGRETKVKEQAS
ncbi:MAG: hypothetical protein LBG79_08620 [Spirochaetaceae bacterium]|jgi:hypothetical protein|nr:hypothetical protein [Spirochaetaceae bacterium]